MTIQLHFSHTLVECETKFGSYRPPYDIDFSAKVTLLSGHINGDSQLLSEPCLSLTLKSRRLLKSTNKNNISVGISSLSD